MRRRRRRSAADRGVAARPDCARCRWRPRRWPPPRPRSAGVDLAGAPTARGVTTSDRPIAGPDRWRLQDASCKQVLDNRPSGTRQRLAKALGKNRSFISQIANPAYPVPIPAQHLETMFELCHFSQDERRDFPRRLPARPSAPLRALRHAVAANAHRLARGAGSRRCQAQPRGRRDDRRLRPPTVAKMRRRHRVTDRRTQGGPS